MLRRQPSPTLSSSSAESDVEKRQILKSPAQVIVLCEASAGVEEMLRQPPEDGNPEQEGLDGEKLARALCGARR